METCYVVLVTDLILESRIRDNHDLVAVVAITVQGAHRLGVGLFELVLRRRVVSGGMALRQGCPWWSRKSSDGEPARGISISILRGLTVPGSSVHGVLSWRRLCRNSASCRRADRRLTICGCTYRCLIVW